MSEELKVDGKKHPAGKVSIVLDRDLLFLRRNGSEICNFKIRKLKFLDEPKGVDRMLLSADGLKFIFISSDATNKSIRGAMGMGTSASPIIQAASKANSTSSSANQRGHGSDSNIQNVHPNRGNSTKDSNHGGHTRNTQTGNSLLDLPKSPPARVANMRSNSRVSSPIDVESTNNRSQNKTIQKPQHKSSFPKLQLTGTKSVSISRAPSVPAITNRDDQYASFALKRPHTPSPGLAEHGSPSISDSQVDFDLVSPVTDRKERLKSPFESFSPDKSLGIANRKSISKSSRDTPVIQDQPRIKALPESRSKVHHQSPSFFPPSILDEQERSEYSAFLPASSSPTFNLTDSAYPGSAVSTGCTVKPTVLRQGGLTFMGVESAMKSEMKSEKAKVATYSRQTGHIGRPSIMSAKEDVYNTSSYFRDKNSNNSSNNNSNSSNNNSDSNNNSNSSSNSSKNNNNSINDSTSKQPSIFSATKTNTQARTPVRTQTQLQTPINRVSHTAPTRCRRLGRSDC